MSRRVSRRELVRDLAVFAVASTMSAHAFISSAQQPASLRRIGILSSNPSPWLDKWKEVVLKSLEEKGYVEGRDVVLHWKFGDPDHFPALAAELIQEKVDVIMSPTTPTTRAAKRATSSIPIVMLFVNDPVESGLVASLSRPGGNVTGMTTMNNTLDAKRLEILKEAVPGLVRVGVVSNPDSEYHGQVTRTLKAAATALSLELIFVDVQRPAQFEKAFSDLASASAQGLLVTEHPFFFGHRKTIVELALKHRLPALSGTRGFAEAGALLVYGTNYPDLLRHSIEYVDKIFKGARPGDLPIGRPTKFELIVNVKTAKTLGIAIPPSFMARADEVIE